MAWSDAARAAALEARRQHMKGKREGFAYVAPNHSPGTGQYVNRKDFAAVLRETRSDKVLRLYGGNVLARNRSVVNAATTKMLELHHQATRPMTRTEVRTKVRDLQSAVLRLAGTTGNHASNRYSRGKK